MCSDGVHGLLSVLLLFTLGDRNTYRLTLTHSPSALFDATSFSISRDPTPSPTSRQCSFVPLT